MYITCKEYEWRDDLYCDFLAKEFLYVYTVPHKTGLVKDETAYKKEKWHTELFEIVMEVSGFQCLNVQIFCQVCDDYQYHCEAS